MLSLLIVNLPSHEFTPDRQHLRVNHVHPVRTVQEGARMNVSLRINFAEARSFTLFTGIGSDSESSGIRTKDAPPLLTASGTHAASTTVRMAGAAIFIRCKELSNRHRAPDFRGSGEDFGQAIGAGGGK
jgi:hypothetical protein